MISGTVNSYGIIAYAQKPTINANGEVSCKAYSLKFSLSLLLHPNFVYVRCKGAFSPGVYSVKMPKSYVLVHFAVWIRIKSSGFHFIPYSNIVHGLHSWSLFQNTWK